MKNSEFCFSKLTKCINKAFKENKLSDTLKLLDVVPVFKKFDPTDKTNFRPVIILPLLSKVFEKNLYDQLYEYTETFLNKFLCGFHKAHSIQTSSQMEERARLVWNCRNDSNGFI